jgi:glucosamine--fructose-6-phosphate aminotransferase (isomerizing)
VNAGLDIPTVAGGVMEREIAEQPAAWRRLLSQSDAISDAARRIRGQDPAFVMFIARGTSDHAALYGKYLAEVMCGFPAGSWSPSTTTLYGATPRLDRCLVIALSQSGGSPDLVQSLASARRGGALTLAITNDPASPLAAEAELRLDLHAGPERAVAATKSYTAELLTLAVLFGELAGSPIAEVDRLPEWGESVLSAPDGERAIADAAQRFSGDRFVLAGRGYSSATAHEGALKLMETCYVSAAGFSGADLIHGPFAMIDSTVATIAIAPPGRGGDAMQDALLRLRAVGSPLLLIGPGGSAPGELSVSLPREVPETLAPLLEILPLQRLALAISRQRGIDADRPRGLLKVTLTT